MSEAFQNQPPNQTTCSLTFEFRKTVLDKKVETSEMAVVTEFSKVPFRVEKDWMTISKRSVEIKTFLPAHFVVHLTFNGHSTGFFCKMVNTAGLPVV